MSDYRVVKVSLDGDIIKYAPQKKYKEIYNIRVFRKKTTKEDVTWNNLLTTFKGDDIFIPCYYDTEDEAWDRIDRDVKGRKISKYKMTILEIHNE